MKKYEAIARAIESGKTGYISNYCLAFLIEEGDDNFSRGFHYRDGRTHERDSEWCGNRLSWFLTDPDWDFTELSSEEFVAENMPWNLEVRDFVTEYWVDAITSDFHDDDSTLFEGKDELYLYCERYIDNVKFMYKDIVPSDRVTSKELRIIQEQVTAFVKARIMYLWEEGALKR